MSISSQTSRPVPMTQARRGRSRNPIPGNRRIRAASSANSSTIALRERPERAIDIAQAYATRFPAEIEEALALQRRSLDELKALYPFIEF